MFYCPTTLVLLLLKPANVGLSQWLPYPIFYQEAFALFGPKYTTSSPWSPVGNTVWEFLASIIMGTNFHKNVSLSSLSIIYLSIYLSSNYWSSIIYLLYIYIYLSFIYIYHHLQISQSTIYHYHLSVIYLSSSINLSINQSIYLSIYLSLSDWY
jgi:hypothetical protein